MNRYRQKSPEDDHDSQTCRAFSINPSKKLINRAIDELALEGYDFKHQVHDFGESRQYQKLWHRAYLRNQCQRCNRYYNSKGPNKNRFTASKGTVEVKFQFIKIQKYLKQNPDFSKNKENTQKLLKLKYPYILLWDFYMYHMMCKKCLSYYTDEQVKQLPEFVYATPKIFQDQLDNAINRFMEAIKRRLNGGQIARRFGKHKYKVPLLKGHKKRLCQACAKGVCNGYKNVENADNDDNDDGRFSQSRNSGNSNSYHSNSRNLGNSGNRRRRNTFSNSNSGWNNERNFNNDSNSSVQSLESQRNAQNMLKQSSIKYVEKSKVFSIKLEQKPRKQKQMKFTLTTKYIFDDDNQSQSFSRISHRDTKSEKPKYKEKQPLKWKQKVIEIVAN